MINLKPTFVLFIIVFVVTAFSGCKKSDTTPGPITFNGPWIKTETYSGPGGAVVITYVYDAGHRLVSSTYSDGSSYLYQYSGSTFTETYTNTANHTSTSVYVLNSAGLAQSIDGVDVFNYDAQNRLVSVAEGTSTTSYSYTNGNLTTETFIDNGTTTGTATYQYFTDKINTTGQQNRGINWTGLQNTNLESSKTHTHSGTSTTVNYTYEYDAQNRVTKRTDLAGGSTDDTWMYTYY